MSDIEFILWCLLQLFLFFLLMKLLSMARLLPLLLYLIGVNTLIPAWAAEHPVAYYGIAALCLNADPRIESAKVAIEKPAAARRAHAIRIEIERRKKHV